MLRKQSQRLLFKAVFFLLYVAGSVLSTVIFGTVIQSMNGDKLWQWIIPVLAVFYGFSALMYNRARALSPGAEQRRSLYAAERSLQATVLYTTGVMFAIGMHGAFSLVGRKPTSIHASVPNDQFLAAVPSILLVGFAWISFYFALRAISHRVFMWQRPKAILRRLK